MAKEKLCSIRTSFDLSKITNPGNDNKKCTENSEQTNKNKVTFLATCIFFTAAILVGFGTTAVNTLGIPYIDDNVAAKESPLYFGKFLEFSFK